MVIVRIILAALLIGTTACVEPTRPTTTAAPPSSAAPTEAIVRASPTPDLGTWDTWFPADIGSQGPGPNCGYPARQKLAAVLSAPQERAPGLWRMTGCFASPGNTFYDVLANLRLADGTMQTIHVLDRSDPDRDSMFVVDLRAATLAGLSARIYFNQSRR